MEQDWELFYETGEPAAYLIYRAARRFPKDRREGVAWSLRLSSPGGLSSGKP